MLVRRHLGAFLAFIVAISTGIVGFAPVGTAAAATPVAGAYVALNPVRLLDTGSGIGAPKALVPAHGTVTVQIAGRGGVPSTGAGSVVLNLAVVSPAAGGTVVAFPAGLARPATVNLAFVAHQTIANLSVTRLGSGGRISIYNGSSGSVRLIADLSGYYRAGTPSNAGAFVAVPQVRILDTGTGNGAPKALVPAHGTVTLQVAGRGGVPTTGAGSVVLTITVVSPSATGYAVAYPSGATRPHVSDINFVTRQAIANLTVTRLGSRGRISIYNGSSGSVRLIADIVGYHRAGSATLSGTFVSLPQTHVLDSANGVGGATPTANGLTGLQVAGVAGVPLSGARAVVLNVTAVAPASSGSVTVYADGTPRPKTANVDFSAGRTISNLVIAPIGADGSVNFYNTSSGSTPLIVDVVGYIRGAAPVGSCTGFANSTGITNTAIHVATAADMTGPFGLYTSNVQATQAYAAYFNSTSSICGRKLAVDAIDTQTSSSGDQQAATTACSSDFAMVGSAAMFDDGGAQTAQDCGIPDLREHPNSPTRQNATDTFAAGYGQLGQVTNGIPSYFVQNDSAAVSHAAMLYTIEGSASTQAQNELVGWMHQGFTFVYRAGVDVIQADYTSVVISMMNKGVQYVQFVGDWRTAVRLRHDMASNGFNPVFVLDPMSYEPDYASTTATDLEGAYSWDDSALLQSTSSNSELALYEHWLQVVAPGATPTYVGLYAWSAAEMFAEQAQALGGSLTRAHLMAALRNIHAWTGKGLHSPQDVAGKSAPHCTSIVQLSGGTWVRRTPAPYVCGQTSATGVS